MNTLRTAQVGLMGLVVLGCLGLASLSGTFICADAGIAHAQDEGEEVTRIVKLTKVPQVTANRSGKGWTIRVWGEAAELPPKSKIRFLLIWRGQTVDTFNVKTDGRTFIQEFQVKDAPVSPHKMEFRTEVHSQDQSSSVKKALKKKEDVFKPNLDPWTDYHLKQAFLLGTEEQINAAMEPIREFFRKHAMALIGLDRAVSDKAKEMAEEKFEEKKWRTFMDKQVIRKIVKIQQETRKTLKEDTRYIPYRRELMSLQEVAAGVALRATTRSIDMYEANGLSPAEADQKPEELITKTTQRPPIRTKYLRKKTLEITKKLGIKLGKPKGDKKGGPGKKTARKEGS